MVNKKYVFNLAKKNIPIVEVKKQNLNRYQIAHLLKGNLNHGIELGVASEIFQEKC